ncbi:MAG: MFS transporter [Alicyclobacillus sp.]|nr:MFS transporter [Alicyclobacillus sp.]
MLLQQHHVMRGVFSFRRIWSFYSAIFGQAITSAFGHFEVAKTAFAFRGLQLTLANGSDSALSYESAKWAGLSDRYLAISGRLFATALISMGIAESVSGAVAQWSWTALYLLYMGANLISFFVTLWIREPRESRGMERRQPVHVIARDAIQFARRSRPFAKWILLSGTLSGLLATFAFYGQALLLHAGWSLIGIGVLSGVENGVGAAASASAEKVVKRFGERGAIGLSGALAMTGLLTLSWLPGLGAGIGFLMNSVAGNLADPMIDKGLNGIVPSGQRATLLSFNSTAFSVFMIVVFPLLGLLVQHIGLVHAAYVGSVVGAVAIVCVTALWWVDQSGRT